MSASTSVLEKHLQVALRGAAKSLRNSSSKESKAGKVKKSAKRNGKNYLDAARADLHASNEKVQSVIKTIGEKANKKKFSKRKLKSIIRIQKKR